MKCYKECSSITVGTKRYYHNTGRHYVFERRDRLKIDLKNAERARILQSKLRETIGQIDRQAETERERETEGDIERNRQMRGRIF